MTDNNLVERANVCLAQPFDIPVSPLLNEAKGLLRETLAALAAAETERDRLTEKGFDLIAERDEARQGLRRVSNDLDDLRLAHDGKLASLPALLAETRKKALEAALRIAPYLIWTIGEESPGHHPTMPSAVAAFLRAFDIDTPEKRRAADHAALHEFLKADEAPK